MFAKAWYKSKTMWFNIVNSLYFILAIPEVMDVLPHEWLPWHALGLSVINIYLRWITTKELTLK